MSDNYNSLLGGGSTPSLSFKGQFPVQYMGLKLLEATKKPAYEYDPSKPNNRGAQKYWPDGNPVENVWLTVQTDQRNSAEDDGRRVLVLDSKNKLNAVQEAVRESGGDFAAGGILDIEWYGNDPEGKNPQNPPKLYRARWTPPTLNDALAGGWGNPAQQQAPAPQQGGWGQQAPSGPPAQGGWGQPAPAPAPASPAQGTGGWGSPPQQAPAATTGWGAPAGAAPAPTATSDQGQFAGQWGAAQPPAPAPAPAGNGIDPGLLAALQARGIDTSQLQNQAHAEFVAQQAGLTRQ